jgi:hypothetical protein
MLARDRRAFAANVSTLDAWMRSNAAATEMYALSADAHRSSLSSNLSAFEQHVQQTFAGMLSRIDGDQSAALGRERAHHSSVRAQIDHLENGTAHLLAAADAQQRTRDNELTQRIGRAELHASALTSNLSRLSSDVLFLSSTAIASVRNETRALGAQAADNFTSLQGSLQTMSTLIDERHVLQGQEADNLRVSLFLELSEGLAASRNATTHAQNDMAVTIAALNSSHRSDMNQTQLQFGRLLASSVDSLALRTASQRHALAAQTWINVTRLSARVHDVNATIQTVAHILKADAAQTRQLLVEELAAVERLVHTNADIGEKNHSTQETAVANMTKHLSAINKTLTGRLFAVENNAAMKIDAFAINFASSMSSLAASVTTDARANLTQAEERLVRTRESAVVSTQQRLVRLVWFDFGLILV